VALAADCRIGCRARNARVNPITDAETKETIARKDALLKTDNDNIARNDA